MDKAYTLGIQGGVRSSFGHVQLASGHSHLSSFHHLQYGKVGRAQYLFSREHDVIRKLQKFTAKFRILFNRLHAQCLVYTTITLR